MSALTATVLGGLAAVRLEASGLPDGPAAITRTDTNGTNAVRLLPGQAPSGGVLIVTDYEAALTGPVTYAVDDATATVTLAVAAPVLAAAGRPNLRAQLTAVTGFGESSSSSAGVVTVLDRDDPIIMQAPHGMPAGTMTVWCLSYADAQEVAAVARSGRRLLFRQADFPGMDAYLVATAASVTAEANGRWSVSVSYQTVATPTGDLLAAAGWNFDAVTASYATFAELQAAFPTFNALTVGP